jgi:trans-2,3-dihydro-3-hydroxyanthranilate isomerase
MSWSIQVRVVRVFTRNGAGGNHLGVVTDVAGLDDGSMQAIAAELGFSETIFVATTDGSPPYVRIFTPGMELPFAGHPLVGAAWMLLTEGVGHDRIRCGIGDVGIRLEGEKSWVDTPMTPTAARPDELAFATRVGVDDALTAWQVSTPLDYRLIELPSQAAVAGAAPNTEALAPAHGLTLYHRAEDAVRMRFFIPEAGIKEDPATGSAAVALATMWAARGEPAGEVFIHQGEEIGHPSRIELRWSDATASIGGRVVEDDPRVVSE